jgi:acetoin:2,6-dichlorophenolindophenol oxidoreductase subunit beta
VIDLRTLRPWDEETVFRSVRKTRRAVILTESPLMGSLASDVSVRIYEEMHHELEAPVVRVGAKDAPIPMSPVLENKILPSREDINVAVRNVIAGTSTKEVTNV